MRDFLTNFVDNKLTRTEQSLDNGDRNFFVRNFLEELQTSLDKFRSYQLFQELPLRTRFHFLGQSGDLLEIGAFNRRELFFVPSSVFIDGTPRLGESLRFLEPGILISHPGGIPLWEDEIAEFRDQCSLAR